MRATRPETAVTRDETTKTLAFTSHSLAGKMRVVNRSGTGRVVAAQGARARTHARERRERRSGEGSSRPALAERPRVDASRPRSRGGPPSARSGPEIGPPRCWSAHSRVETADARPCSRACAARRRGKSRATVIPTPIERWCARRCPRARRFPLPRVPRLGVGTVHSCVEIERREKFTRRADRRPSPPRLPLRRRGSRSPSDR